MTDNTQDRIKEINKQIADKHKKMDELRFITSNGQSIVAYEHTYEASDDYEDYTFMESFEKFEDGEDTGIIEVNITEARFGTTLTPIDMSNLLNNRAKARQVAREIQALKRQKKALIEIRNHERTLERPADTDIFEWAMTLDNSF